MKIRTCLLAIILLVGFSACNNKKKIRGDGIIPRDKMVEVVKDMHLVDAVTNDMAYYRKYNPGDSIDLYSVIFEKHDITAEEYERTIHEYSQYPALLDALYNDVVTSLKMMEEDLDREEETEEEPASQVPGRSNVRPNETRQN